jgi:hypothetical protein
MNRRNQQRPKRVFISHAHQDRVFVRRLVRLLQRQGIQYWYSPKHIVGGQQWHDEIGKALANCDWFLLVLSPAAVNSRWVGHEYFYALNDERYASRILPLLHRKCRWKKLSWTLGRYQWVDFVRSWQAGSRDLLRAWGLKV